MPRIAVESKCDFALIQDPGTCAFQYFSTGEQRNKTPKKPHANATTVVNRRIDMMSRVRGEMGLNIRRYWRRREIFIRLVERW
jgi:hypothetical protein